MPRLVDLAGLAAAIGPSAVSYRVEGSSLSLPTAEDTYVATHQRAP